MKGFLSVILLLMVGCINGQDIDNQYVEDYLERWQNSQKYLLDIVRAMPEDKIAYKPTEDSKSFREIAIHIVSNMVWLGTDYFEGGGFENEYKNIDLTKEELIDVLEKAFAYSEEAVRTYDVEKLSEEQSFFAGPMTGHQLLRLMNDHCSHHRGQLTMHLRMNNIAVPRYVGW